ncbi:MarR family transcriptional regulator [Zavarzinia compransoris]|uniref:MarR family winged helix-turn-helix transcriptional regulator n=1 Tax=Zavarzinia marina TaxID=2911065 RepID=UPI001F245424|nr:MarR family transcriptional regulator [Zavarzinia marina]MCF4165282.1 MarR family transcriptional regulator [Zavarzinia marina]
MSSTPRLFHLLNRARNAAFKTADGELLTRLDVTAAQLGALFVLGETPDCTPGDLAERLDLNASAVTGLAERLERAGLIRRRPHETDRRVTLLALTRAGRDRIAAARPLMTAVNARLTEGFTAEEVALVARFLETAAERFATLRNGDDHDKKRRVSS